MEVNPIRQINWHPGIDYISMSCLSWFSGVLQTDFPTTITRAVGAGVELSSFSEPLMPCLMAGTNWVVRHLIESADSSRWKDSQLTQWIFKPTTWPRLHSNRTDPLPPKQMLFFPPSAFSNVNFFIYSFFTHEHKHKYKHYTPPLFSSLLFFLPPLLSPSVAPFHLSSPHLPLLGAWRIAQWWH